MGLDVTQVADNRVAAFDSWLPARRRGFFLKRIDEYWPLAAYFYLFPLWWVLGLSQVILFILAMPMLWQLIRHRDIRVPRGFGVYLVFLVWVVLGVAMLWVKAPGTEPKSGLGPLLGFGFRGAWYAAVTIACLYVLNADRVRLSATRVIRMVAYLFVITTAGGVLGITMPNLDFPSVIELFLPQSFTKQEFMNALFHPRVALASEFLGYSQPRTTAPYSYPNTWGNAYGLLIPFFCMAWLGKTGGWRRYVGPFILVISMAPVVYSLNRGLWLGLTITAAWVVLRRLMAGDFKALVAGTAAAVVVLVALIATPLGTTISLRVNTPHSDDRRQDTASEVISATWQASPILGYGSTRQKTGNYKSLAGGGTPGCHQCSAPPLGTQGFLWGLVFMTGFVGALLMLTFLLWQFQLNARRTTPLGLLASTVLISAVFYFLFYDSLDVPMLVTMMVIGLSTREHAPSAYGSRESDFPADFDPRGVLR